MKKNPIYEFETSISLDAYENKEISGAMIGSRKNADNREIRKKYGFNANMGIGYKRTKTNSQSLMKSLINGHVMCNLFKDSWTDKDGNTYSLLRSDGTFGSYTKRDINFEGSWTIGVDIDETKYTSVKSFIDKLSIKPSFWYTSYSHLQPTKGVRFRLFYVLDEKICYPLNYRYVAYCLNSIIERQTEEIIKDDCNLRCSQYFNGTNINTTGVNVEYGCTDLVYSLSDFGCSDKGFIDFLNDNAKYKTVNKKRTELINRILNYLSFNRGTKSEEAEDVIEKNYTDFDLVDMNLSDEDEFEDWDNLLTYVYLKSPMDVRVRFGETYKFVYRKESNEWVNGLYQRVDEDYFKLYWYRNRLVDGQLRGKNLFQRMMLRRILKPEITHNELLYNAIIDVNMFIDNSDGKFNIDHLKKEVVNAMKMEIADIEEQEKVSIEYLKAATRPKKGIIYKDKTSHTKETTYLILDDMYDKELSVKENLKNINEVHGYSVAKDTIYGYLKDRGINQRMSDDEIKGLLDINLSVRNNLSNLKERGIKISIKRVCSLLRDMKNITNNNNTRESEQNTLNLKSEIGNSKGEELNITESNKIIIPELTAESYGIDLHFDVPTFDNLF